ncbi:MAG: hypothetical protein E7192_00515 [Erysipelotrichaceae bacterium]|nr:hypothetical protein [Erysipelotrichaceae bacterium]
MKKISRRLTKFIFLLLVVSLLSINSIYADEKAMDENDFDTVTETIDVNLDLISPENPYIQTNVFFGDAGNQITSELLIEDVTEQFQVMPIESGEETGTLEVGSVYRFYKRYYFSENGMMTHEAYIKKTDSSKIIVLSASLTPQPPQNFALHSYDLEPWVQVYDWEIRSRGYATFYLTVGGNNGYVNRYVDMSAVCSTVGNGFAVSYYFSTIPKS